MATNRWRGDAIPVAQVETFTVGSATVGQTFGITINLKTVVYTAVSGDTIASIATNLQGRLSASGTPAEFQEVTWTTDGVSVVTATAAVAGVPFVTAVSGTGTLTKATVTSSAGPNDVSTAANWTLGAVPGAGDDVLVDGGGSLLYGLGALTAAAWNSLRVKASFTGQVGLPVYNSGGGGFSTAGSSGYYEYRTRQLAVYTGVPVTIGEGAGSGPTLVNLTAGSVLALTVLTTGSAQAVGGGTNSTPAVNVAGCSSGVLVVAGGSVGLGVDDNTLTATVTTASTSGTCTLAVGQGVTITTLNQDAGVVSAYGTVTTLNINSGAYTQSEGSVGTIVANGGTVNYGVAGTITSATFQGQGGQNVPTLACGSSPAAKTITNGTFTGGAVLSDPYNSTTWTNFLNFDAASLAASNLGPRFTLKRV